MFELSFLDGDISRLFRFREAILDRTGKFKIICFPEQIPFLKEYFGDMIELVTVNLDELEDMLEIKKNCLL